MASRKDYFFQRGGKAFRWSDRDNAGVKCTDDIVEEALQVATEKEMSLVQYVDMRDQLLTRFAFLGRFENLTELNLNNNGLTSFPRAICELTQLTLLSMSYQAMGPRLPTSIGRLQKLTYFALYQNQFAVVPPQIARLTQVKNLWLAGNPLPDAVCKNTSGLEQCQAVLQECAQLFQAEYEERARWQQAALTFLWLQRLPAQAKPEYLRGMPRDIYLVIARLIFPEED